MVFAAGHSKRFYTGSSLVPAKWLERDGRQPRVHLAAGHCHLAHRQAQSKDLRRAARLPPAAHVATASVGFFQFNLFPDRIS